LLEYLRSFGLGGVGGAVRLLTYLKGDRVSKGEPIAEVEIEKAVLVIESPYSGIVKEILVSQGDSVYPGSGLVRVEVVGEG